MLKPTLRLELAVCGLLCLVTAVAYYQVAGHDFVDFDDVKYVSGNEQVQEGLTFGGVAWAFSTGHASNWHPLTWLSHMLDCQLFGTRPVGHHVANWLLHTLNTCLLFVVLHRMTRAAVRPAETRVVSRKKRAPQRANPRVADAALVVADPTAVWKSAWVAAMFAVHPLHVESVAWVAERKDVLSTLFWLLTMVAYLGYLRHGRTWPRYALVTLLFGLGLLSKPMLVTLPLVLLLVDDWPLGRNPLDARPRGTGGSATWRRWRPLVIEKTPLLVLAALSSIITAVVQRHGGAMQAAQEIPLGMRLGNAVTSYATYLVNTVWPIDLAICYPHPAFTGGPPPERVLAAALLLAGITALVIYAGRTYRYLVTGWLWYLGALVPVIGLLQVGDQARADRYTYIPLIGIFIMLAWGVPDLLGRRPAARRIIPAAAFASILACTALTWRQVRVWENTATLANHALRVTDNNFYAHHLLGLAHERNNKKTEAIEEFQRSLQIAPFYVAAHHDLAKLLVEANRWDEARRHFAMLTKLRPQVALYQVGWALAEAQQGNEERAVELLYAVPQANEDLPEIQLQAGEVFATLKRYDEAIARYQRALELGARPHDVYARVALAHQAKGDLEAAAKALQTLIATDPRDADAQTALAGILLALNRADEAVPRYREVLRLRPDSLDAMNNLAWILATHRDENLRDGREAVELATRACQATNFSSAVVLDTLAAAYAEAGDFSQAIETIQRALEQVDSDESSDHSAMTARLELYRSQRPYRDG